MLIHFLRLFAEFLRLRRAHGRARFHSIPFPTTDEECLRVISQLFFSQVKMTTADALARAYARTHTLDAHASAVNAGVGMRPPVGRCHFTLDIAVIAGGFRGFGFRSSAVLCECAFGLDCIYRRR